MPELDRQGLNDLTSVMEEAIKEEQPDAEQVKKDEKELEKEVQYDLSDEEKNKVVEHIVNLVDESKAARADWEETRKECVDLLNGVREPKSEPWPNCSNVSTRIATSHSKLMHAKLFPTIWNKNLVHWRPVEQTDVDNVEKVRKFMDWVVNQDMGEDGLQNKIDDIVWDLVTNGTVALKTKWVKEYRTVAEKKNNKLEFKEIVHQKAEVENVPIDEVYLPDLWKGVDKSEFIAQNVYMKLNDIKDLINRNIFIDGGVDEKLIPQLDERLGDSITKRKEEIQGTSAFTVKRNNYPIRLIECYMRWPVDGEMKESVFTIAYESKTYLSGKPLSAVNRLGERPWVIGQFIRRTGQPYGISLIELIKGLAKEIDAIHNQRIDAGNVGIAPFGFYRAASGFEPEEIQIGPGTMVPVDDINDVNIIQLTHNPVASFQEERLAIEYLEKLTTTASYHFGRESEVAKSRATATSTLALISQGEQSYIILGKRIQSIIARLLENILEMYQSWMPSGYAETVLGEDPGSLLFPGGMMPKDIAGKFNAYMTLDSTTGNKMMERQVNELLVQMAPTLLGLSRSPQGYEIAKEFLSSIGKVDIEKYIGPKPQKQGVRREAPGLGGMPGNMQGTEGVENLLKQMQGGQRGR